MDEQIDLACITATRMEGTQRLSLSSICPPSIMAQHHVGLDGQAGGITAVYRKEILLTRSLVQQSSSFQCFHLMLGDKDIVGPLLVYWHPPPPNLPLLKCLPARAGMERRFGLTCGAGVPEVGHSLKCSPSLKMFLSWIFSKLLRALLKECLRLLSIQ